MANFSLPDLTELGEIARKRRKESGLSQKALADLANCSHVSIIALEKGTGKLNQNTAWRILRSLGLVERPRIKHEPLEEWPS
jgi:transcriptional regulator with XRE-family HTH domain